MFRTLELSIETLSSILEVFTRYNKRVNFYSKILAEFSKTQKPLSSKFSFVCLQPHSEVTA